MNAGLLAGILGVVAFAIAYYASYLAPAIADRIRYGVQQKPPKQCPHCERQLVP